ncbi:TadE/TadG family type IV pilus assembly protein [Mangrovibrevibacter kandeliae]|uniref:TadE/TadG family type IV pilus assembly protein n=1 Tax=Mangrovibrevibacter kandeliae TaxID=2968473 RepID=UPI00211882FF|nr:MULTISPECIES: TadE/TadG family type IV pilus assembly protein [unclassified Aurantimonas]MCQ8784220.1 pilus assembly protein [Aurantimonas sp. CSK15Z-1]MCW4116938.1 pilus assembly protein [Aurantimonas sp. MSK8Z-1]
MSAARLRAAGRLRRFLGDRRAMGAVEFALIAPFLLTLYLGGSELSMLFILKKKVQHVGLTISDLVTKRSTLSKAEIDGMFALSDSIVEPYDPDLLQLRITAISIDGTGKSKVAWTRARSNSTSLAVPSLPADFNGLRDTTIVIAETRYPYTPLGGYGVTRPLLIGGTDYLVPRLDGFTCSDCS